ncbi:MAG: putative membrane protein, partial [Natrialbaceae archaeon]
TWFPRLNDGQKLVINPPGEYAPIDTPSDRGPVNGSLIWEGPRDFEPGYFSIVYVASIGPGTTTTSNQTTATSTQTTTTPGGPTQETSPTFWMGVVLLVFAVGAGGYFYAVHRRDGTPTAGGAVETDSEEGEDESAQAIDTEDVSTRETSGETSASTVPPTESAMGSGPGTEEPMTLETDTGIDPELLSDEERVERLLERNGGRMKQANIVTETGWSNAKVSQLLSSMAEEDRINKLRIGRENLITLPDEDVTDF